MEVTGAWVQIPGREPPPKQRWPGTLQRDQGENSEFLRITATFFFFFFFFTSNVGIFQFIYSLLNRDWTDETSLCVFKCSS